MELAGNRKVSDTQKQIIKRIVCRDSGVVLGGEIIGGATTGEFTYMVGFMIQNGMTVDALLTAQICTHPLLTASPAAYPLIKVAEIVSQKRRAA